MMRHSSVRAVSLLACVALLAGAFSSVAVAQSPVPAASAPTSAIEGCVPPAADKAYEVSSLLTYVPKAQRPLLIIHGTADDNVYFLHTLKLSEALFNAGKKHSVLPLSNFTHLVPEPLVTLRLWERVATEFKEGL